MESQRRVARPSDGFNIVARDLDRAIALAKFSTIQTLLFQQARELSWSRAREERREASPFRINVSALARVVGASRPTMARMFKEMVASRIFLDVGDGSFLINKDYREWLDASGHPRLTPVQVEWCMAVIRNGVAVTDCILQDTECIPQDTVRTGGVIGECIPQDTGGVSPRIQSPTFADTVRYSPPVTPHKERAPEEEPKKKKEENHRDATTTDVPLFPSEDGPLMVMGGNHALTDQQAREIWALLWRSFKNPRLCNEWYEHQRWYGYERWLIAVRVAVRLGKTPTSVKYLERIAGDESQTGEDKPAARNGVHSPSPPSHAENFGPAWFYRRRGLPLPVGHPEYGKEAPGLPQDATSDDFGSPDPPGV